MQIGKNEAKTKQHPEAELLLFRNYSLYSSMWSSRNNRRYFKNCTKANSICFNEVIWLMAMNTRLKVKRRSRRYDINRPRPRHRRKYTKYKMRLSVMMVLCIKQHPNNIWSSICEKVKQHCGWVEKECCLFKKACMDLFVFEA